MNGDKRRAEPGRRAEDRHRAGLPQTVAGQRHAFERWGRRVAVAFALLIVCGGIAIWSIAQRAKDTADTANRAAATAERAAASAEATSYELRATQIGACHRNDVGRADDNRTHYADFVVFTTTYRLLAAQLGALPPAQRRRTLPYLRTILAAAHAKSWVPLTRDCGRATLREISNPPAPIPFYTEPHGPPASAFRVGRHQ